MSKRKRKRMDRESSLRFNPEFEEKCFMECNHRPSDLGLYFEDEKSYYERFAKIMNLKFYPARYYDQKAVETLGIKEDIDELFDNLGWKSLLKVHHPSYDSLTIEFLSTVKYIEEDGVPNSMTFRVGNMSHEMTCKSLNDAFGTNNDVPAKNFYKRGEFRDEQSFWRQIAIDVDKPAYNPRSSKASKLRNPILSYAHRILQNTVFARFEVGAVRSEELYLLHSMLNGTVANFGAYLMPHLTRQSINTVCTIGGMITHIALKVGWKPTKQGKKEEFLDIPFLIKARVITKVKRTYCAQTKGEGGYSYPLDRHDLITWKGGEANWLLRSPVHLAYLKSFHKNSMIAETGGKQLREERTSSNSEEDVDEEGYDQNKEIEILREDMEILRGDMHRLRTEQTSIKKLLKEQLRGQRAMIDWHVSQGHFQYEHPPP